MREEEYRIFLPTKIEKDSDFDLYIVSNDWDYGVGNTAMEALRDYYIATYEHIQIVARSMKNNLDKVTKEDL